MIVLETGEPAVVTDFPYDVREIEHVWIPMSDGVRLSARLWLPETAERDPVPAILEYIPYRKRDGTRRGTIRAIATGPATAMPRSASTSAGRETPKA